MALYKHSFVDLKPITEPQDFMPVLEQVLGKELIEKVAAQAGTVGKETLGKNTDKAIADGAFGMPWYMATNAEGSTECFWGFDHLGQVLAHLGLDRATGKSEAGWRSML
ncbi:MAG: hypothetical protein MMC23_003630 [Stictis urceolatum]|nr:hypothetical protein [Stictis urceolata]